MSDANESAEAAWLKYLDEHRPAHPTKEAFMAGYAAALQDARAPAHNAQLANFATFFSHNYAAVAGGRLELYEAGTMLPVKAFQDAAGTIATTRPIILNARGEVSVWMDPAPKYKAILKDPNDRIIWAVDNFSVLSPITPGAPPIGDLL